MPIGQLAFVASQGWNQEDASACFRLASKGDVVAIG
jgi:hypothetical protein